MKKYSISIFYSEDDGCYVASVPELEGCMAHGETREEAMQEIQDAIEVHIQMMQDVGRELPLPVLYA